MAQAVLPPIITTPDPSDCFASLANHRRGANGHCQSSCPLYKGGITASVRITLHAYVIERSGATRQSVSEDRVGIHYGTEHRIAIVTDLPAAGRLLQNFVANIFISRIPIAIGTQ